MGKKYGYIDHTGKMLIPLKFDCTAKGYLDPMGFSDGLACAQIGKKIGYIDHTGQMIIQPEFIAAWPFSEGIARVMLPNTLKDAYIDKNGKVLFTCAGGSFLCTEDTILIVDENRKMIFADKSGKNIFNKSFYAAHEFSEGLAAVSLSQANKDSLWGWEYGYINRKGDIVIAPKFHIPGNNNPSFVEGRAIAAKTDISPLGSINISYGIIDKSANWIVQPQYMLIGCYRNGLASVYLADGSKCGFIDRDGKMAIEAIYRRANSFSDGLAAVWISH